MADQIAAGDVVRLKSGGPKMTVVAVDVAEITEELSVWCEWFDDQENVARRAEFSMIAVEKFVPREPKVIRYKSDSWMA
jgi:uncharacterized protein YodC (DUF2158 family)